MSTRFYFDDFDTSGDLPEPPDEPEPPTVPSAFWEDTFTDPDDTSLDAHTSDGGAGYTFIQNSDIVITNNRARCAGLHTNALLNIAEPPNQEYDIEFTLERFSSVSGGRAGIITRASADIPAGGAYRFFYDDEGSQWIVATYDTILDAFPEALDTGSHLCKVEIRHAVKRLLVFDSGVGDFVEKVSTTDDTFGTGGVGLFFRGTMSASTGTHIDNVQAIPLRAEFYFDTFTAADGTLIQNHTSDSGATYTVVQGAADIINNRLRSTSATRGIFLSDVVPPGPEYAFEFEFEMFSALDGTQIGVVARATDADPLNEGYYLNYSVATERWQIRLGLGESSTVLATFPEVLTVGTHRCLVEIRDEVKRLSLWDGTDWQTRVETVDNSVAATGSVGVVMTGEMGEFTGLHLDIIEAIEAGTDDPNPPNPDTAPEITEVNAPNFNEVELTISPDSSGDADNHDLHRIVGNINFDPDGANLHAAGIGNPPPVPYSDIDNVIENTTYSYRVAGKQSGNIISVSNRRVITTPFETPPPTGSYPNLPADFTDLMFVHDCSFWPALGTSDNIDASTFGVIAPTSPFGSQGNNGSTTGAIPASQYVSKHPTMDGTPSVEHGPTDPHGQDFCFRTSFSRGTASGKAIGNNAQMSFRHSDTPPSGCNKIPFRAIYQHYWLLMEGVTYDSPTFGATRALQAGSQYRQAFQFNQCCTHHHGGLVSLSQGGSVPWGINADDGSSGQIPMGDFMTHCTFDVGLNSVRRNLTGDWPGPRDTPGNGAYGNGNVNEFNWRWTVGDPRLTSHNNESRVPNNAFEVGKWNRIEIIFIHSDLDTENGSLKLFINGNEVVATAEPIITRSSTFRKSNFCSDIADDWWYQPQWYFGFHSGVEDNQLPNDPHNRYASFADFYYAGIRAD